jgi:accessory gene regulator protein AgrB
VLFFSIQVLVHFVWIPREMEKREVVKSEIREKRNRRDVM